MPVRRSHPFSYGMRRCNTIIQKRDVRVNEEIRIPEVRVVDDNNQQIGIMSPREALRIARERDLDLVEIAPTARPPVCRIMDYGKYRYEQSKRSKEARKKQKVIDVKEVRMTPKIDEHDFQVKYRRAEKFLKDGDKVKCTIRFRGREIVHSELGKQLLQRLADSLSEIAVVERPPRAEGRNMIMILAPKQ